MIAADIITRALTRGLEISTTRAAAITSANTDTINVRCIPDDAQIIGHIDNDGSSHVCLLTADLQPICELRVPAIVH